MANTILQPPGQPPTVQLPQPTPPNRRFRWEVFVLLPAAILTFLWLKHGMLPSFQFEELLDYLNIANKDRFVRLITLGIVCIVVVSAYKALTRHSDKP